MPREDLLIILGTTGITIVAWGMSSGAVVFMSSGLLTQVFVLGPIIIGFIASRRLGAFLGKRVLAQPEDRVFPDSYLGQKQAVGGYTFVIVSFIIAFVGGGTILLLFGMAQ